MSNSLLLLLRIQGTDTNPPFFHSDDITDAFGPAINEVERDAEAIEDAVFIARNEDFGHMLKRIGDGRKKIMGLMRLLGGKADVIKGFAKRCNEHYEVTPRGEIGLYLGDIQDHVITMMGNLTHFEKMLSRSHRPPSGSTCTLEREQGSQRPPRRMLS